MADRQSALQDGNGAAADGSRPSGDAVVAAMTMQRGDGGGTSATVRREMRHISNKLYVYNAFDLHLHYISSLPLAATIVAVVVAATTIAARSIGRRRLALDRDDGGGGEYDGDGGGGGFSPTVRWKMGSMNMIVIDQLMISVDLIAYHNDMIIIRH
ncbi:hypothetical protein Scep_027964 [Stephania cephalantha]|uniref:Uncharacterized protein n=1 Tax=Stephania cephalantha TaxID=152367 RepID=A0AAP0EC89_9MAGN